MLDLDAVFDADLAEARIRVRPTAIVLGDLPADWRELYEERAAIMEFDGGLTRGVAEGKALEDIVRLMSKIHGGVVC